MSELKRTLGLAPVVFFGVGSILGAGIYTIIGKIAGEAGNMLWLAFAIASVTALITAFSYAELSSMFPKAGGEFRYATEAFGINTGFVLGIVISLNGIISGATVATGFAGYLSSLLDFPVIPASLGIIALLFLINIIGIRQSSAVNIVFTIIEASGLLFIIFISFDKIGTINLMEMPEGGLNGLFMASALAFYAYIGFEEIVKLSEETRSPETTIPRALFVACAIVIAVYITVAICAVSAISPTELSQANNPLARIAGKEFGNPGLIIISIIALFATSNTVLSNMLGSSRVILDMATERKTGSVFSKVSAKSKTPVNALILILFVMAGFALIGNIETIARIANIFIFITFIVVNVAVIVLRIQKPDVERPYRVPVRIGRVPMLPAVGIVMTMILFVYNIAAFFE